MTTNNPNVGQSEFTSFYTQNTGISNACNAARTRPPVKQTNGFGLVQLMTDTTKLPCHENVSNTPVTPLYNSSDKEIVRYNVFRGLKERCGCGGIALPLPKF
jgi:hypothetical protein